MEWIKCKAQMPEEHPSPFAKLKQRDKKYMTFPCSQSYDVLVTYEFEDGSRDVGIASTMDGEWTSHTLDFFKAGNKHIEVISWMPYPAPDPN